MKKPRTEVNARRAAVAAEAQARAIQDDCLQQAIANESATRAESDSNLLLLVSNADLNSDLIRDPFDAEAIGRTAAIAAEAEARIAADAALGNRIDTEASQRKQGDAILGNRIASSTATAIAMGGALVLPDYDFTLSANAGFYEGAQAIAINGAARVSDSAYVTGALGGGLNKRGAVGARVGFAVGFCGRLLKSAFSTRGIYLEGALVLVQANTVAVDQDGAPSAATTIAICGRRPLTPIACSALALGYGVIMFRLQAKDDALRVIHPGQGSDSAPISLPARSDYSVKVVSGASKTCET